MSTPAAPNSTTQHSPVGHVTNGACNGHASHSARRYYGLMAAARNNSRAQSGVRIQTAQFSRVLVD